MKIILLLALTFFASFVLARDVYVNGYTRKDGTYVQGHYRTAPNNSKTDNYSTYGNTNPYNGKQGTINPYESQSDSIKNNNSNLWKSGSNNSWDD